MEACISALSSLWYDLLRQCGHLWQGIASNSGALLLGGVSGGAAGAILGLVQWWYSSSRTMARHLLSEALRIQAMVEAWIVVGANWREYVLDPLKKLPTTKEFTDKGDLALYSVELRATLDSLVWNSPRQQFYAFIDGRRTWIVRERVLTIASYGERGGTEVATEISQRQAIISSRGMEELCGWIEQVAGADFWLLKWSKHAQEILLPILPAVAGPDRLEVFGARLSRKARQFLEKYRQKNPGLFPDPQP